MGATAAKFLTSLIPPLPFLLAGCLPLWVGALLAGVSGLPVRPGVLGAGSLAVLALILAAFAGREAFCPGAGRCPSFRVTFARRPKTAAFAALAVAAVLGLALQFGWRTGDFTIPLGGLGILGGYFAFAPPLAWHRRGLGEAVGGFCFGLLPVATGLYLQCGQLLTEVLLYGLPLTFTGFNLFLIYGTPGPEAAPGSGTLAARVAPTTAALILAAFAGREAFCPGAGRCPAWRVTFARQPKVPAYAALAVAAVLGLALQFGWRTGDFTIPLGALGILGGYFTFAPPLAWHRRGLGEAVGGFCFGLLPVATGLYLQCGQLLTEVLLYGLPLTFTGFNLFLVYGTPGPEAAPGSGTLAARLEPTTGALIFTINNVLTIIGLALILIFPAASLPWRFGLWPLLLLAVINQELVKRKAHRDERRLKLLARLTLTLHLGMGLVFVLMLWQRL